MVLLRAIRQWPLRSAPVGDDAYIVPQEGGCGHPPLHPSRKDNIVPLHAKFRQVRLHLADVLYCIAMPMGLW